MPQLRALVVTEWFDINRRYRLYLCEKTLFETGKEKTTGEDMAIDRRKTDVLNLFDRFSNANSNMSKKTYHL